MIHAFLDSPATKNILGYELGTRVSFDAKHAADPLWAFLDYDIIKYRVPTAKFLLTPKLFYIDAKGAVQQNNPLSQVLASIPGYVYLTDPDGAYLTDPDGAYIIDPE